jgi:hypothetical protein
VVSGAGAAARDGKLLAAIAVESPL